VEQFEEAFARIAGRFGRVEPRRRARSFLLGVLADVETRSCWQLAEQAGERSPHGMQRLLAEAVWDADAVRDDLRSYVADRLGDPAGVLILDDTGDLKKGYHSVGVQRQYTGTAGRIENAQVGVFLGYAARAGYTLIDREIYLPRSWTDDPDRCAAAGVPDRVGFATKIRLARRMLARALAGGIPAAWVSADEGYGGDRHLRGDLQARGVGYVLAVAKSHQVSVCAGIGPQRVDRIVAELPARCWNRLAAGEGSKGWRDYDWAWIRLAAPELEAPAGGHHWLLIRRRLTDGELAFYRCWSPRPVGLPTLARVAGTRWCVETCFQTGKNATGLDQHQVRRWRSWYRWVTLAMLAYTFLVVAAVTEHAQHPAPPGAIELTCNEIQHLFAALVAVPVADPGHRLRWSWWRRRQQARARACHYRRQAAQQP
jgi:SRSO17 transposase